MENAPDWLIVVVVAFFVLLIASYFFIKRLWALPPLNPPKGENARFMRYLSCAIAMCSGDHRDSSDDACDSIEVESVDLEYEFKTLVKGCRDLCLELRKERNGDNPATHYCGKQYAFNYTLQEDMTYRANYTNYANSFNFWAGGFTGKNDIIKYKNWRGEFINEGCWACGEDIYPDSVGWLFVNAGCDDIAEVNSHGQIWVSDTYGNCVNSIYPGKYDECSFNKGDEIYIWADKPVEAHYDCLLNVFGTCLLGWCAGTYHTCPHVAICENAV